MRFVTDPSQAQTVKMKDGTEYKVGHDGHVVITAPDHVAEMERGNKDYFTSAVSFGGEGVRCRCRRLAWRWERVCPRCGQVLHSA
jgi:hypothetical protein